MTTEIIDGVKRYTMNQEEYNNTQHAIQEISRITGEPFEVYIEDEPMAIPEPVRDAPMQPNNDGYIMWNMPRREGLIQENPARDIQINNDGIVGTNMGWSTSVFGSTKPYVPPVFEIKHKDETLVKLTEDGKLEVKEEAVADKAGRLFIKSLRRQGRNFLEMTEELNTLRNDNSRLSRNVMRLEDTIEFLTQKLKKYGYSTDNL